MVLILFHTEHFVSHGSSHLYSQHSGGQVRAIAMNGKQDFVSYWCHGQYWLHRDTLSQDIVKSPLFIMMLAISEEQPCLRVSLPELLEVAAFITPFAWFIVFLCQLWLLDCASDMLTLTNNPLHRNPIWGGERMSMK